MSGTVLMSETKPCRTTAWSSTTMSRIFSPPLIGSPLCRPNMPASPLDGDADRDLAPAPRLALDVERAAHLLRALAHPEDAEVAVATGSLRRGVEAAPVVPDAQAHVVRVE